MLPFQAYSLEKQSTIMSNTTNYNLDFIEFDSSKHINRASGAAMGCSYSG